MKSRNRWLSKGSGVMAGSVLGLSVLVLCPAAFSEELNKYWNGYGQALDWLVWVWIPSVF